MEKLYNLYCVTSDLKSIITPVGVNVTRSQILNSLVMLGAGHAPEGKTLRMPAKGRTLFVCMPRVNYSITQAHKGA